MPGWVVAKVAIQDYMRQRDQRADQCELSLDHGLYPQQFWVQRHDGLVRVFATFGPTWFAFFCFLLSFSFFFLGCRFFSLTTNYLLDHHGI